MNPGAQTLLVTLGILYALAAGGCHLIFRYEDNEADASVADAAAKDMGKDRQRPGDLHAPDRTQDRAIPGADLMPKKDMAIIPDAGCGAPTQVNSAASSCGKQCLSGKDDQDCDGLPQKTTSTASIDRDPWPTSCNRLLVNEDFAAAPVGAGAAWSTSGFNPAKWSCGQLSLTGASLTLTRTSALTTPKFLVEAKVTLGAPVNNSSWAAENDTGQGRLALRLRHLEGPLLCQGPGTSPGIQLHGALYPRAQDSRKHGRNLLYPKLLERHQSGLPHPG